MEQKIETKGGRAMFGKKRCVAMLLAGGQGSRLAVLTHKIAKPAVKVGGKYRIIDFTLSNCINSGIDTVGVLTQYRPFELNSYVGNGEPWDLDRMHGGVHILPPYQGASGGAWYKGTANAVYQNLDFLDRYHADYVLILSGDHIYKMDYTKMLNYHIEKNADCTIAVLEVPLEEAFRFGIMNTNEDDSIYEFEEKPLKPKSTKASMGVYIFTKDKLKEYLEADEQDPSSSNDFGKNVIPAFLANGERLFAYPFQSYWCDVGTLTSLWSANMDFLAENPDLDIYDPSWKIYYRHNPSYPHYMGENAVVQTSLIGEAGQIDGTVQNSVLFEGVKIEKGAVVKNSVLMGRVTVKAGAQVNYCIIDDNAIIGENVIMGAKADKADDVTVVGNGIHISPGTVIGEKEIVGKDC